MIYLDTNVLVSLHVQDSLTERVELWLAANEQPLATSEWVRAEFYAVAGLRKRKDELTMAEAKTALAAIDARIEKYFVQLPVSDEAATLAASWLRHPDCALQTGDALHLAIARKGGATALASCDERFAKAALKLKLASFKILLIPPTSHRIEQKRAGYSVAGSTGAKRIGKVKSARQKNA